MAILKYFFLFFSLIFFECLSQNSSIDSLQNLLQNSLHDSERVKIIIAISDEYEKEDSEKALETSEQALALAVKMGNSPLLAKAYYNLAYKHFSQNNYELSLLNCQNSLGLMLKASDSTSATGVTLLVSSCYMKLGKYKESIETILTILPYAEKINQPSMLANIYTNLGNVYNYMNRNNEAFSYYLKALDLMEKFELISPKYVTTLNNAGIIFYSNFQMNPDNKSLIDSSIQYSNKALMVGKKIQYDQGISTALGNIGMAYESIEEYEMALKYYLESLEIIKKTGNQEGIAFANNNLGYVYENLGKYDKAIEHLQTGLKMAQQLSMPDIIKDSYFGLSETYVKLGDYKKAHGNYLLYSQVKDSLFDIESHQQIAEMQTRYETEKKEKQLQIQTLELSKKDSEVKKQRLLIWSVIGGLLLVIAFAFLMYTRFRIISKQKHIIEKQKTIVDEKNKHLEEAKGIIEEKNKDMVDSIRYAKRIQDALLPSQDYLADHLGKHFVLFKPKDIVSGDFYWVFASLEKVIWAACDCTGHGVPGAFMSMIGNSLLNEIVVENGISECDVILNKLREGIIKALGQTGEAGKQKDGMDMVLCALDKSNLSLTFAGANNPLWIIRATNEKNNSSLFIEVPADKQPIGFFTDELKSFTKHNIPLQKGDSIYSFTDGFADQFGGPKGKKFKYSQFKNILLSIQDKPMEEQKEILNNAIEKWRGTLEQVDDICVIGMRV